MYNRFHIKGAKAKPILEDINFNVREGEIVGIAGISGNGQSELLQAISGLMPYDKGTITIQGMNVTGASVKQIRESGLAHIPEDRYLWGVSKDATVSDNGIMGHLETTSKYGIIQGNELYN